MKNHESNSNNTSFKINKGLYFLNIEKYSKKKYSDLWEDVSNRKVFLTWIFVFLASIIIINALSIISLISFVVDKNTIINNIDDLFGDNINQSPNIVWRSQLINICINLVLQLIILISLIFSIYNCIKNKSFKFISFLPTMFVFIEAIFGILDLIQYAIFQTNIISFFKIYWVYVLNFSMMFVYIIIWFCISRNVSLIRNISIQLEMKEKLVNSNFYYNQPNEENKPNSEIDLNSEEDKNNVFYSRMKELSRDQLNEIAKQLSISGYETMPSEELIKIISDIRNMQKQDSKEKEIKIEENDNKQN